MITFGIKPGNLKEEIELIKMVYKKLASNVVWDIVITLSENGGAMTEAEIAKELFQSCSNLSPHINFLLAINILKSENDNEQLTKGTRVYLNERYNLNHWEAYKFVKIFFMGTSSKINLDKIYKKYHKYFKGIEV